MRKKAKGILFIVTAPSGAGKTTIRDAVIAADDNLKKSITCTTRGARPGEVDGIDYFFLTKDEFEKRIKEKKFLEYAVIYNNYYGTNQEHIESEINTGNDVILVIDVQGALSVKKQGYPAIYIYILPPSLEELRMRLEGRRTDSAEVVEKRFARAQEEMSYVYEYDYCIINDNLQNAIADLKAIVLAERRRVRRQSGILNKVLGQTLSAESRGDERANNRKVPEKNR